MPAGSFGMDVVGAEQAMLPCKHQVRNAMRCIAMTGGGLLQPGQGWTTQADGVALATSTWPANPNAHISACSGLTLTALITPYPWALQAEPLITESPFKKTMWAHLANAVTQDGSACGPDASSKLQC